MTEQRFSDVMRIVGQIEGAAMSLSGADIRIGSIITECVDSLVKIIEMEVKL